MAGNRFSPITPDDHAGLLWIVSILCIIYTTITLVIRAHVKWKLYGLDDILAAVATGVHFGQCVGIFKALGNGLGKRVQREDVTDIRHSAEGAFAATIMFILSIYLSKMAILALMSRIFQRDRNSWKYFSIVGQGILMASAVASIVSVSVKCSVPALLQPSSSQTCGSQHARWQIITALDIITELVLVSIPIFMVHPLQMSFDLKFQVVLAFALRLPLVALAAVHLKYVDDYLGSSQRSFTIISSFIVQQSQLCWSLLSATAPNLRSFMKSFHSGFGMNMAGSETYYGYGSHNSTRGIRLNSLRTEDRDPVQHSSEAQSLQENNLRPDKVDRTTSVCREDKRDSNHLEDLSTRSGGSQEMIIRKDVGWSVHY